MKTNALAVLTTLCFASVSFADTLYVDDSNASALYAYALPSSSPTTLSTTTGSSALELAVNNASGMIYAAVRDSNEIIAYTPTGSSSVFESVSSPYGIAVDASGNVYASVNSSEIMKYSSSGGPGTVFENIDPAQFLAIDSSGNVYTSDNSAIYKFAPNGTGGLFASAPSGFVFEEVAVDSAGNIYAGAWNQSSGNNEIIKYTSGGSSSVFATFANANLPLGMAYDPATSTLYVGEAKNGSSSPGQQVVYAVTSGGSVSTFATGLFDPYGLAIDAPTPEPGTLFLLAAGVACIAIKRRHPPQKS